MNARITLLSSLVLLALPRSAAGSTFWLDAQSGYELFWLNTIQVDAEGSSAGRERSREGGPVLSTAIGGRLYFATLGLRARSSHLDGGWLWRVGPELGLRIPLGRFEPHLSVGVGYATLDGARRMADGLDIGMDSDGLYATARLGLDYYVFRNVSLGACFTGDAFAVAQPGVPLRGFLDLSNAEPSDAEGARYGGSAGLLFNVGAHF